MVEVAAPERCGAGLDVDSVFFVSIITHEEKGAGYCNAPFTGDRVL